ncbi:MAG: ATP-binding cassette domain-containing protein, partial [Desulfobulbaceae bacterium]|nr:ATP-binding cassette domain-containing protein [Desulfobulbaceae bacterium]
MQHTSKPVIEFKNVQFSFTEQPVLEDVTLKIHEREMIGIIGPNGSGKTTLLRLILGLLRPDSGEVQVFGEAPSQVAGRLGYVPQHLNFDSRFPVTAFDVVLMGLVSSSKFGPYSKKLKEKALQALEMVELADFKKRGFAELSGGQRQRVLIAR